MITNYEGDKEPEFTSTAAPAAAPPRSSVAAAAQVEVPAEARRPGCGARMWPGRDLHSLRAETAHAKLCSLNNTLIWPSWSARGVAPHQPQWPMPVLDAYPVRSTAAGEIRGDMALRTPAPACSRCPRSVIMLHEHIILYLPWLPDLATGQASHAQRNKHVQSSEFRVHIIIWCICCTERAQGPRWRRRRRRP